MADSINYSNLAGEMRLVGTISSGATSLVVDSTAGLPASLPYKVVLDVGAVGEEIVKVTAVAGTTLTVTRGYDGTAATGHNNQALVRHMVTAEDLRTSRQHEGLSAGVHGATGTLVGTSDAQTLTNKNMTSGTNTFPSTLATLTGSQVLTNKDLTSGTNTFPTSLVTLTGSQTLTNKTLTSPTITGTGAIAGASVTTTGTVTGSNINSSNLTDITFLKNPPMARATQSGTQSLTTAVLTAVNFGAEAYDTDNMHDNVTNNTRLTVNTAGTYHVQANATFSANATGERLGLLRKNGSGNFSVSRITSTSAATDLELSLSGDIQMSATDYVELIVRQTSGGSLSTGINQCWLSARWVSL